MSYTLQQAVNPELIMERQWGQSPTIMFNDSSECIGVLARNSGESQVIGIHLSMYDDDGDELFSQEDVGTVVGVLTANGYDATSVIIIGRIASWSQMAGSGFDALMNTLKPVTTRELPDGIYGAKIDGKGNIQLLT